jgi:hypothetical protein
MCRILRGLVALFLFYASLGNAAFAQAAPPKRWFAENAPWNVRIKPEESLDPSGEGALEAYRQTHKPLTLNKDFWTPTIVRATRTTPRRDILWSKWMIKDVPIPQEIFPIVDFLKSRNETDRSFCIYDEPNNKLYTFWKVDRNPHDPDGITVGAGALFSVDGSGWWDNSKEPWGDSASGRSGCAGLVTPEELQAREIPHAIGAGWPRGLLLSRKVSGSSVYPAKTTDGASTDRSTALATGTRLQLDPRLTDDDLRKMGLKRGDIIVAHAMQKYGVYITDSSNVFSLSLASAHGQSASIYPDVSTSWPNEILTFIHVTLPASPATLAPLENRYTQGAPVRNPDF